MPGSRPQRLGSRAPRRAFAWRSCSVGRGRRSRARTASSAASAARSARRLALFLVGAALVAGDFAPWARATAPGDAPRETVLRGEVVETGCFIIGGRRGEAHRHCAIACARAGQDLGILDEKSKTLFIQVRDFTTGEPQNPLLEHVAQRVEVRGTTVERGGIRGIVVRQVKPLTGRR